MKANTHYSLTVNNLLRVSPAPPYRLRASANPPRQCSEDCYLESALNRHVPLKFCMKETAPSTLESSLLWECENTTGC
jgi:hypothetical protein